MTSIVDINRWRQRTLHTAKFQRYWPPPAERTEAANRNTFVAVTTKSVRIICALAVIVAYEIGDSCLSDAPTSA